MSLAEPFVRRPVMTIVSTLSIVLFGVLSFLRLPVDALPPVDYPVIQVTAVYPGASPDVVAATIATPLERQFMQIPGLEMVTSKSSQGNASFTLQFALTKSLDAAATDVQSAISRASGVLPSDMPAPPTFTKSNPNDQPILYVAITSDTVTQGKLYDYASTQIGQRVSMVPGVARVDVFGTKSAIRIKADPEKLAARGLSLDDVAAAIRGGTSQIGAGQLDSPSGTSVLKPLGQLDTAAGYRDLVIASADGAPLRLSDVATVVDTVQDERISMRFNVTGYRTPAATVVIAVNRQAGANVVEVARQVRALLPVVSMELPASIQIVPVYDRSLSIVRSVADVEETLLIAFALVVVVIFVFLGRATDTLIPVVALPLSLLLTFIAMNLLGFSLDNLSLMALTLAIGFLVDDAIVFLENTVRRMERGEKALEATLESAKEISFTIVSMTISLAAVFLPLMFMSGLLGRIFREFAVTIVVAILASGLVSLTLTPLMTARMLKDRGPGHGKTWVERAIAAVERPVLAFYGRTLTWFLRLRVVALVLWAASMAGTVWLYHKVPQTLIPPGDSSVIFGAFVAKEGSSPTQMRAVQDKVDATLRSDPNVVRFFSMTGNGAFVASNMGITFTFLKPAAERGPIQAAAFQTMGRLNSIPGVMAFLRPFPVLEITTGATNQLQGQYGFSVSGVDPNQVYEAAGKLMAKLAPYEGFASFTWDRYANTPNLDVAVRRDQARTYGVSETRVLSLLRTAYAQNYQYLVKAPTDQYQVILEATDSARRDASDLSLLRIRSDDGAHLIPLSALVDSKQSLGPQAVNHINQFTSVTFSFNLKPDVAIGDATKAIEKAAAEVVPLNLRSEFQGEAKTFQESISSFIVLSVLAVFVMYVILAILYESFLHPVTVLSTLPTALVGGFAALAVFGEQLSLYGIVGMFMLMGIVKKNGVLIVDFAIQRVAKGETAEHAIHDASIDRFRPILMTTLAAVIGAVPIALGYGADGASRRPLGLVIVGGLVVSQFLTLYVTPVIYLYLEDFQEKVLDRTKFFRSSRTVYDDKAPDALMVLAPATTRAPDVSESEEIR